MADILLPRRDRRGELGRAGYVQLEEERHGVEGKRGLREQFILWIKTLCKKQICGVQNAKKKPQAGNTETDEKRTLKEHIAAKEAKEEKPDELIRMRPTLKKLPVSIQAVVVEQEKESSLLPSSERCKGVWARCHNSHLTLAQKENGLLFPSPTNVACSDSREQEARQMTLEVRRGAQDSVVRALPCDSTMTVPESPVLMCPKPAWTRSPSAWTQGSATSSVLPEARGTDAQHSSPKHGLATMTRLTAVLVFLLGKELVAATRISRQTGSIHAKSFLAWMQSFAVSSTPRVDTNGLAKPPCFHQTCCFRNVRDALDVLFLGRQLGAVAKMPMLSRDSSQLLSSGKTQLPVEGQEQTFSRNPWYLEWIIQSCPSFQSFTVGLVAGLVFSLCVQQGILHQVSSTEICRRQRVVKQVNALRP